MYGVNWWVKRREDLLRFQGVPGTHPCRPLGREESHAGHHHQHHQSGKGHGEQIADLDTEKEAGPERLSKGRYAKTPPRN
jgi:hypothetical protein